MNQEKCCELCNSYKNIDGTDKFYWECNNPSCPCHTSPKEVNDWESDFRKKYNDMDVDDEIQYIRLLLSSTEKRVKEETINKILNALRYVVAEDEDGYDTLEEIIKVAGIENQI